MKVEYIDHYGSDLMVANCARVSFNKWKNIYEGNDQKLIKYLARENHIMPFCHPVVTMRITAPIYIARQLGKHQVGCVWSEVSRRYVDYEPVLDVPDVWRKRAEDKKQGSLEEEVNLCEYDEFGGENLGKPFYDSLEGYLHYVQKECLNLYDGLLEAGVCPEQARMVLPQNMETTWIWTCSLAAWARIYNLRNEEHAQKEVQDVAREIDKIMSPLFPDSWMALTTELFK